LKPLFITRHALLRVRQREITLQQVKTVIREPDLKGFARHGRLKAQKQFGDRELIVIYAPAKSVFILVTAYWRD